MDAALSRWRRETQYLQELGFLIEGGDRLDSNGGDIWIPTGSAPEI